ncbi:MAG: efflux RND transporter periplasmic adaptor subunit [Acidobacteria bacterium]|nr:efflux RND transporter periplasmic adaptor subunit [Acidobacteriota bacterium]
MRKEGVIAVVVFAALAGVMVFRGNGGEPAGQPASANGAPARRGGQRGGGQPPGGAPGAGMRPPMTVEVAPARRETVSEHITVVGNLIGAATVEVVPKVSGRLQTISVRLGDAVRKGQTLAKVEDREIREQVRQAEASFAVAGATIRQREADLKFAETNLDRSRSLFQRQLLPKQTLDDAEARYQAAVAQLDLARAQFQQARARLDELHITLSNTSILSPVDGFVAKRNLDPGAFAGQNSPIVAVVDLSTVRMVANLIERDARRVHPGTMAAVEVDAYPGERFDGRVARVAPVFDPATRTAEMEIEVPNPSGRLKPGMYARVNLMVGERANALVVPRNAVVDIEGRRGVFVPQQNRAAFRAVETGLQDENRVEITKGLGDGAQVITTGAVALRDGDPIHIPEQRQQPGRPMGTGGRRPDQGR